MDTSKLVTLAVTLGALYAAYRFGNGAMKGAALGVAGVMVANNLPYVRDGLQTRLVA